jgi:hypothetical protein
MVRQVLGTSGVARRRWVSLPALIAVLALAGVAVAAGTVQFDGSPGTKAPPKKVGGLRMKTFPRDHRHRGMEVTTVNGPTGQITFGEAALHLVIKNKKKIGYWRTWSHNYHGDVYYVAPSATLSLPADTTAFYFYVEPNDPGTFKVTASTTGASSGPVKVTGKGGARFFGFVAKAGAQLTSITVSSSDRATKKSPGGFAIGEFGIHKG